MSMLVRHLPFVQVAKTGLQDADLAGLRARTGSGLRTPKPITQSLEQV